MGLEGRCGDSRTFARADPILNCRRCRGLPRGPTQNTGAKFQALNHESASLDLPPYPPSAGVRTGLLSDIRRKGKKDESVRSV
jgi:hypothetical protein